MADAARIAQLSGALFGNASMMQVVLILDELGFATAQVIHKRTDLAHSQVRDVLQRLEKEGIVSSTRDGDSARAPRPYSPRDSEVWRALVQLCELAMASSADETVSSA